MLLKKFALNEITALVIQCELNWSSAGWGSKLFDNQIV